MQLFPKIIILIIISIGLTACKKTDDKAFTALYIYIEQDNFFKLKEAYEAKKHNLSKPQQSYVKVVINNAFNQLQASEEAINTLLEQKEMLPDSLWFKLFEVKSDNEIKLFQYAKAGQTTQTLLNDYAEYLDSTQTTDYKNSLKLWTALEQVKPQQIVVNRHTNLQMNTDLAGLKTLEVTADTLSFDFIFDTGANLSTTTAKVAKQLKMKLIPVDIEVGTITGTKVPAQLAVAEALKLGNIELYNVVFLVLPDEALSFPQINYQIYGIIGFPVMEALKEIQITKDGQFIVPERPSDFQGTSNMALKRLTPLIYCNNMHFTFDSGADYTMLYHNFYKENQTTVENEYQSQSINFGGAGGQSEFEGYRIDYTFQIGEKEVTLKEIPLLKEKIKVSETVYGNIGQDLIQRFDTLTLNFEKMFIKLE